tara:strand:+ start:240 stop:419 length:180 start_codon:yes stop_codon:yes gene_type:complete
MTQIESKTAKFKKSTARYLRNQVQQTKHGSLTLKILMLEVLFAAFLGLTASYGYVHYVY